MKDWFSMYFTLSSLISQKPHNIFFPLSEGPGLVVKEKFQNLNTNSMKLNEAQITYLEIS